MAAPCQVGILILPRFPLLALSSLVAPLHEANRLSGTTLYSQSLLTPDDAPVTSEGGVPIAPTAQMADARHFDLAIVVAGTGARAALTKPVLTWIRWQVRQGAKIGAVSTATLALAAAGALGRRRCTIHWENAADLVETYPEVSLTQSVFEIDGPILTCGGGTASMDMILNLIARDHGADLAIAISHQFQHERIRTHADLQESLAFYAQQTRSPKLAEAIRYIRTHGGAGLTPCAVAAQVSVSQRQLDRLFRSYLGKSPQNYLIEERVRTARDLILGTDLPLAEIAIAAGFGSRSSFYRAYRDVAGKAPGEERNAAGRFTAG